MRGLPIVLAMVCACGASKTYSVPGCGSVTDNPRTCPDTTVFECATRAIAAEHASCAQDEDCVAVSPAMGSCTSACVAAVRADQAGAYDDQIANELTRFCEATVQQSSTACDRFGDGFESCAFETFPPMVAACIGTRCTLIMNPDAGGV